MVSYPEVLTVQQTFNRPQVEDVAATVREELSQSSLVNVVRQGDRVAITAGSRGITDIKTILRTAVAFFKECGAVPFVVPSMGSHGGATAAGQLKVLAGLGLTEESLDCPIDSNMQTVLLETTADGIPVYFDQVASQADHTLVNLIGEIMAGVQLSFDHLADEGDASSWRLCLYQMLPVSGAG